jgi:iron(III) transport system ATP-binding protein
MIDLKHLSRSFGPVRAVDDVSLSIAGGDVVVVQGPSGGGKTTLLRLVAGLELPDAGEILLDGERVSAAGWATAPHTRGIGIVFQRSALWPHMTVAQNVCFAMSPDGNPRGRFARQGRAWDTASRLELLLGQTSLAGLAGRYPAQLSGGEARRVALARALAARPQRLLLDEPLTNLDPELKSQLLDTILHHVQETGATLLYVTHDGEEAHQVDVRWRAMDPTACVRRLRMERGRIGP